MSRSEIFQSLNKVFELMMGNKFREDMDDTLLEKPLSIMKLKISKDCFDDNASREKLTVIQDLLLNTQVLHLAEKVIMSLNNRITNISPSIQKFTIELIGILFGNKDVFVLYKESIILRELSNILRKNTTTAYSSTIQSALLLCFTNISKHFQGIMWLKEQENLFWKDTVLKRNLHQIVWEMGVDGIQEGMLKAASLQATLQACRVSHFWKDIQSIKKVDEEYLMKTFFQYYHNPDFYVQRESLTCILEWLKDKEAELPLTCRDPLLIILSEAMKSLDMDQKVVALKAWTWLIESDKFFPGAMESVDNMLTAASELGFASSLVVAVEDYDESIQYKAAEILINFRRTLLKMGCTKDYSVAECPESTLPQEECENKFSFEVISKEERDAGIENVVMLTTAEQIAKLAFTPAIFRGDNSVECTPLQMGSLFFPINSFLKYVWSSSLDSIISKSDISIDLFSEYTLSLLDDIIASDRTDVCRPLDDIPDCY